MPTGGSAASTTTIIGKRPGCRARAPVRSTIRRSRRSAPIAICRSSIPRIRPRSRESPLAPVCGRQYGAAVRQRRPRPAQGRRGLPQGRSGDDRRVRDRARRSTGSNRAGGRRGRGAPARQHVCDWRGIIGVRITTGVHLHSTPKFSDHFGKPPPSRSGEGNPCGWKWSSAPGRSVTSFRAAPLTPSTCGSNWKPWTTAVARSSSSGALQGGSGPVDPGSHFYRSLLLDEHGNRSTSEMRGRPAPWPTSA